VPIHHSARRLAAHLENRPLKLIDAELSGLGVFGFGHAMSNTKSPGASTIVVHPPGIATNVPGEHGRYVGARSGCPVFSRSKT
jgi:hypothetical protein